MPFPYLAPLSPWSVEIFEEREKHKLTTVYKHPWICLTSSAKVVNAGIKGQTEEERAQEIDKLLNGDMSGGGKVYNGCIIANNIGAGMSNTIQENKNFLQLGGTTNLSYSLGATPVGIDLDGKIITVEGETGRRVSTPIVESMDLDTDGANNTLKTAKISVKCFTLKQLEMFEMFFMKPGINILVEFGDNYLDIRKKYIKADPNAPTEPITQKDDKNAFINGTPKEFSPYEKIEQALVKKNDFKGFCQDFSKYFRSDTNAIGEYLQTVRQSFGSYDRVAGKVLDYNFSINDDGTYQAQFEVSQGNQLSMAIPQKPTTTNSQAQTSGPAKDVEFRNFDTILTVMASDLNLNKTVLESIIKDTPTGDTTEWSNHLFNFVKINTQQKDTAASDKAYVSLKFVLMILMNYIVYGNDPTKRASTSFFKLNLPGYKKALTDPDDEDKLIRIIPVESNKMLISSNQDIIYPRKNLPTATAVIDPENKDAKIITLTTGSLVDGRIDAIIDFDTIHDTLFLPTTYYNDSKQEPIQNITPGQPIGDALHIFINYARIVGFWKRSYTRMQFLDQVLNLVNDNSYGLFHLVFGIPKEDTYPVVMNHRWQTNTVLEQNQPKNYRFKPTTINSIVKQFSFNFEMSNLVAGMTIFNTRKMLAEKSSTKGQLPLPPSAYKLVEKSMFGNADGYYTLNYVEYLNLQELDKKRKEEEAAGVNSTPPPPEDATKEPVDYAQIIKDKCVNFIFNDDPKNLKSINTMV